MKLEVFLSYTGELADYPCDRGYTFLQAAIDGVSAVASCRLTEMKGFAAQPARPPDVCRAEVFKCDVYVGIIGFCFGSEVPGMPGKSYVEIEYEAAKAKPMPTLLVLLDDTARACFPAERLPSQSSPEKIRQDILRARLTAENTVRFASNPAALREGVRQALQEHVQSLPAADDTLRQAVRDLPTDVVERIERYRTRISSKDYESAFHEFFLRFGPEKSLNYLLDFVYNRCDLHLELVEKLFAHGVACEPPGLDRSQCAKTLNALARAYKNTGRLHSAIETFSRQLRTEVPTGETGVLTLQNYVNALRLAGMLREATQRGHELWQLSRNVSPRSMGYCLYWNGIVAAVCGSSDDAELLLRQAEAVFEDIAHDDRSRGLGRTYAHLAQLELWSANAELARRLATCSYRLALRHDESREHIFTSRLMGMAALMQGDEHESRVWLQGALASATAAGVGYDEEELAATVGLAELDHRGGNLTGAEHKLREAEARAREGHYALLLADVLNALARVLRDDRRHDDAVAAARDAYHCAWCDGPPYAYAPGLRAATQLLAELGTQLPSHSGDAGEQPSETQAVVRPHDTRRLEKACWRCKFFKYMRVITGPYRYAPTKFIKLLREDWNAVGQIVRNQEVTTPSLPPQYVEIHLGEPCNLSCLYCRGLRSAPSKKWLACAQVERLVNEIHTLNPSAFIRFSGLIGEPLLHPDIVKVFNSAGEKPHLKWGVTTNGTRMAGEVLGALMNAEYVHVSLDAGSDTTYRVLKKGPPGCFETVLGNIEDIVRRRERRRTPRVIVSVLLQRENYPELANVSRRLQEMGVDSLEVKMQHFDPRRHMSESQVKEAYRTIEEIRQLDDPRFRVVVVQDHDQALKKVQDGVKRITFPRCYANALGLNATVSPDGNLQTCCQYYQNTLGRQGSVVKRNGFHHVWESDKRKRILRHDPRGRCVNCSPSDEFVNEFVDFLRKGYKSYGEDLLAWVKRQIDL